LILQDCRKPAGDGSNAGLQENKTIEGKVSWYLSKGAISLERNHKRCSSRY